MRVAVRGAFPIALLLLAGFFFGGRLGWWSDDYWHNVRDPVTDEVRGLVMHRGFFLRPLFYVIVPALTTALWHHDWAAHAIGLVSHAVVVGMLWRLLVMLGIGRRAAGAAAMLFMVYPAQFEALFWVAALPTSMSSVAMLGVMMLAVGFARGRVGWWMVGVMGVLTFAACCLNEQAASATGVLPVLAWVVGRRTQRKAWGWLARALAPGAVCVLAGVVYVAILRASLKTAPAGVRGSAESLVALDRLWERTVYFGDVLWRRIVMKNWAGGALKEGWRQVVEAGWFGWLGSAAVVGLGIAWAWSGARRGGGEVEHEGDGAPFAAQSGGTSPGGGGWGVVALGLAVFVVGWLPILAMAAYEPDSRCRYWPDVGLAMMVGATFHAIGQRIGASLVRHGPAEEPLTRGTITGMRLALVGVLVAWAVMLVGVQAGFRSRWRMDQAEGAELRRLVPSPAPFTMFVPLEIRGRALQTGAPVLDTHFRSVWEFPWTTIRIAQSVYRRNDLRCGYWRHWTARVPVRGADEAGIRYEDPNVGARFPELPDGTHLIPWERAVPFTIGADRVLRVVTRIVLERAGEADIGIDVPQAKGLPTHEARLPRQ